MNNILKIFKADLKGLFRNFFAFVIAAGVCLLPALYAWFNIYSNWDPYANTGNIKIAVASLDDGWTNDHGEYINMGEEIKDDLREKTSIGWTFVDSEEDAVEGVKAGDYYAAVVVDKDFTYSMYNAIADNMKNPKITYYENQKKNAVASKITDTAVSTLQSSINKQFVKVVTESLFETSNELSNELDDKDVINNFINKLDGVNNNLQGYSSMIDSFVSGNEAVIGLSGNVNESIDAGKGVVNSGIDELNNAQNGLSTTSASFNQFSAEVNQSMKDVQKSINTISDLINSSYTKEDAKAISERLSELQDASGTLQSHLLDLYTKTNLGDTNEYLPSNDTIKILQKASEVLNMQISSAIKNNSSSDVINITEAQFTDLLSSYSEQINSINSQYQNSVVPQVNTMIQTMSESLGNVQMLLTNLNSTMDGMKDIFASTGNTLDALNVSMGQLQHIIGQTSDKLTTVLDDMKDASESEQMDMIMNLLSGDPEVYSEFFSEPVHVESNYVYEIMNYGSGVAPFYTVLAIWVGMTILVSIVKVHADTSNMGYVSANEKFFGRYLLFFVLSQIQTLVIVLGDLYLLKIQCIYPFEFWLAAAVASFAFSMLIYALTIAFGDIGKALAVVVMVIQIAGSGGTYPIEALPGFFRAVYIFFPFPYAIDALRECIGGMYQNTYAICLVKLGIFVVAGLAIGLVIRIPFMKINHFIEERMEDTKML